MSMEFAGILIVVRIILVDILAYMAENTLN